MSNLPTLYTVGEAMLRYSPSWDPHHPPRDEDHQDFSRSIAGDELNVAVAMARLSRRAVWVSVVPEGPMGDVVVNGGAATGVDMRHVIRVGGEGAELGTMTVLPQQATVHYQRRNSAIARHNPDMINWEGLLAQANAENAWLHVTGITPLVSSACWETWHRAIDAALAKDIPISFDLNHRKQLGTLEQLWSLVSPYISRFYLAIFSTTSIRELALLHGLQAPSIATPLDDEVWITTMQNLRKHWNLARMACCFKMRDDTGLQRRWSVVVDDTGVHTSVGIPVFHRPHDELGGGSAWAAGFIDAVTQGSVTMSGGPEITAVLHHADILSAMCQETVGDWSDCTRAQLDAVEAEAAGKSVAIPLQSKTDRTRQLMERAGVAAIIRASNPDVAIERAVELVGLGAKCVEITMDSVDWLRCLKEIVARVPPDVVVGIGTVMDHTVYQLKDAAAAGARFALSPINPRGFIAECHRLGLIAVPSAYTTNEIWTAHQQGAGMVKLYPASMLTSKGLRMIRGVGEFARIVYMPSGGIDPSQVEEWWEAGASCVGLGTNLTGRDFTCASGSREMEAATADWNERGREAARALFAKCAHRAAQMQK